MSTAPHLPIAVAASLLLGPLAAYGQEEPAKPPPTIDPDEGIPHPAAPDWRTGHWLIHVGAGVLVPSAELVPPLALVGELDVGVGTRLHIGYGLSRHVVLQLDGGVGWLTGPDLCDDCSALTFDVGLGVAYHLAQGIAFDPWVRYGAGYRHSLVSLLDTDENYPAFDVARLALGGDFYPVPTFGFGPYLETDIGVRMTADAPAYVAFHAGLRLAFDPVRSGASAAAATPEEPAPTDPAPTTSADSRLPRREH